MPPLGSPLRSGGERASGRTTLARDGFSELGDADRLLTELSDAVGMAREEILVGAASAADPDAALSALARIARRDPAAVGSALASYAALRALEYRSVAGRLSLAYAAGFTAFKGIILAWALVLGGLHTAMAPDLLAEQFVRNGAILIGLYALYRALVAIGVPAPPQAAAA